MEPKIYIDLSDNLPIGTLVIAPFEESGTVSYYRATIISYHQVSQDILVKVFYNDYGNTQRVVLNHLMFIDPESELYQIPSQALKCVLANVQPSMIRNPKEQWSDPARDEFEKMLQGNIQLFGEIYSVVSSVIAVKLYRVDSKDNKIDLNQWLIDEGFAQSREESYFSRCNHELRVQQADMDIEQQQYYEEQQYENSCEDQMYPEIPSTSHFPESVRLKGPYSHLEMDFVNLIVAGRAKKIKIEPNSVNSVLLDTDPADHHERLLVAGSVGQNVSGERLTLRNTTLMPNIHGLLSFIALIFAPTMELRRSPKGSKYSGALCGLGFDPKTKRSLFPDHDMNIIFDVNITVDDLQNVSSASLDFCLPLKK